MTTWFRCVAPVALVAATLAGCGREPPRSLHESAGRFSYDPPPGWTVGEYPGMKYRIAAGPEKAGFSPNINVVDEAFAGPLPEYIDANVAMLQRVFEDPEVIRREDFQTADMDPAARLVVENPQHGRDLRQTFYFFDGKSRKYVVTCTALSADADAWDAVFESSMKSFRIH